jgi:hypothetical protein
VFIPLKNTEEVIPTLDIREIEIEATSTSVDHIEDIIVTPFTDSSDSL